MLLFAFQALNVKFFLHYRKAFYAVTVMLNNNNRLLT